MASHTNAPHNQHTLSIHTHHMALHTNAPHTQHAHTSYGITHQRATHSAYTHHMALHTKRTIHSAYTHRMALHSNSPHAQDTHTSYGITQQLTAHRSYIVTHVQAMQCPTAMKHSAIPVKMLTQNPMKASHADVTCHPLLIAAPLAAHCTRPSSKCTRNTGQPAPS